MWSWILRLGIIAGGLLAIPQAGAVVDDLKRSDNELSEARKLEAQEDVIRAKNERLKTLTRLFVILTSIAGAVITVIMIFKKKKTKKRKK